MRSFPTLLRTSCPRSPTPRASQRRAPRLRTGLLVLLLVGLTLAPVPPPSALAAPHAAGAHVTGTGRGSETSTGGGARDPALERPAPDNEWVWPTGAPASVLEGFDPPSQPWGAGHRGVDLALAVGSPVLAAGAGTVAFAGLVAGRPVVSIDHDGGIRTTYEPVEPTVSAGDRVTAGQVIGVLLPGHRADGVDALHWGARTGRRTYINPLRLLRPAVIRLKPAAGRGARHPPAGARSSVRGRP